MMPRHGPYTGRPRGSIPRLLNSQCARSLIKDARLATIEELFENARVAVVSVVPVIGGPCDGRFPHGCDVLDVSTAVP